MVFFNRTGMPFLRVARYIMLLLPSSLLYTAAFNRKNLYRLGYLIAICYSIGYFRRPYVARSILQREEQQTQEKGSALQETLSKLDIRLNDFAESYFVVIAVHCGSEREEELLEKEKAAFELNAQINSKLEISPSFYKDIKLLFIGNRSIFELLSANSTILELYEKEKEQNDTSSIYIFAREQDGSEKFLSSLPFKPDLNSILRIISKHRARKFAASLQF